MLWVLFYSRSYWIYMMFVAARQRLSFYISIWVWFFFFVFALSLSVSLIAHGRRKTYTQIALCVNISHSVFPLNFFLFSLYFGCLFFRALFIISLRFSISIFFRLLFSKLCNLLLVQFWICVSHSQWNWFFCLFRCWFAQLRRRYVMI